MDRIMSIEHVGDSAREESFRAERLRHRRAAQERCVRAGILSRCTPAPPERRSCCRGA